MNPVVIASPDISSILVIRRAGGPAGAETVLAGSGGALCAHRPLSPTERNRIANGSLGHKAGDEPCEEFLIGIATGQVEHYTTNRCRHASSHFEELKPDGGDLGICQVGAP